MRKKYLNTNTLWGDELSKYLKKRYLIFKYIFMLKDESDIYDFKLAEAMYEYGYDDAIYAILSILKKYEDDARLKIILGALRRKANENICTDLSESRKYWAEKWIFNREHDVRAFEQLDIYGINLKNASISEIKKFLGEETWKELDLFYDIE